MPEGEKVKLENLTPKEKVALTVDMVDTCLRICAEGIRNREPNLPKKEVRKRLRVRLDKDRR